MAKKKLKTIETTLIGCGSAVTLRASDTVSKPIASYALDEFKRGEQMQFEDSDKEYYVPFHAVDRIKMWETEATVEDRPDPYGCEAESDVCTAKTLRINSSGEILSDSQIASASEAYAFLEKCGTDYLTIQLESGQYTCDATFASKQGESYMYYIGGVCSGTMYIASDGITIELE